MRQLLSASLLCLFLAGTGAGCGGGAEEPPKPQLPAEDRAKKAKEMSEGVEKQQKEAMEGAASRRPGGR